MMHKYLYERYERQIQLNGFGKKGQQQLLEAKVIIIGAGGLGCPALQYLAAAGIGNIGIADDDIVALNNIHRQILYSKEDVGFPKVIIAKQKLKTINDDVNYTIYNERITTNNAIDILKHYDIVIDATDNFESRYLINDACVLLGKPLIYGAISTFEGHVAVFNIKNANGGFSSNYRDLFPKSPNENEVPNCAEAGVLGVLPGIIGTMLAAETIKFIANIGKTSIDQLISYNMLRNEWHTFTISKNAITRSLIPKDVETFKQNEYHKHCVNHTISINADDFIKLLNDKHTTIIDVREYGEEPIVNTFSCTQIPLSTFNDKIPNIDGDTIILFCKTGKRSMKAAMQLIELLGDKKKIFSLQGGIESLLKIKNSVTKL